MNGQAPSSGVMMAQFDARSLFEGCTNLETVDINYHVPSTCSIAYNFTNAFKNCKSLKSVNLNLSAVPKSIPPVCDGMFSGCLLGPEQLLQIANCGLIPPTHVKMASITIGVDSTKVSQEDIDSYWNVVMSEKGFSVMWEFNTPE